MKKTIDHPTLGKITYEENVWTGKKYLSINDEQVEKVSKNEFVINSEKAKIKGSIFSGITLYLSNQMVQISQKPQIYEYILAILPFIFLLIWGNSAALCRIFPVVGGAIGGLIGGLSAVLSIYLMTSAKKPLIKVTIGIGFFACAILIAYLVAILILASF